MARFVGVMLTLLTGLGSSIAVEVNEVIGTVTGVDSQPLMQGMFLAEPCVIQSGPESRIQLSLGSTILRLGADSVLEATPQGWRLRQGNILFSSTGAHPRNGEFSIGKTIWTVRGGVGFAHLSADEPKPEGALVGAITDGVQVRSSKAQRGLDSADLFIISASGDSRVNQFDLPKQLETSLLVNGFETPFLEEDLAKASAHFTRLQRRGFIDRMNDVREHDLGGRAGGLQDLGAHVAGRVSVVDDAGFESRLSVFSHLLCIPIEGKKQALAIDKCAPPPPPVSNDPRRKFRKFKEKVK